MLVMHEETFGPLVAIATFEGVEEAIQAANSTQYGLVSYVYTSNPKTAFRIRFICPTQGHLAGGLSGNFLGRWRGR